VFLRLLEKDRIQQSSVVVVEFNNHEILAKIGLRAKRRGSPPLALRGRREAMSWHDNSRQALSRGARSGVKHNLESTIGLQL
jgi:hypothetical protein